MHLPAPESHRAFWLLAPNTIITAYLFWDLLPICTISVLEPKVGVLTWLEECLMTSWLKVLPLKGSGMYSMSWEGQLSFLVRWAQVQLLPLSGPQCQTWSSTLEHTHYWTPLHWSWHEAFLKNCFVAISIAPLMVIVSEGWPMVMV